MLFLEKAYQNHIYYAYCDTSFSFQALVIDILL